MKSVLSLALVVCLLVLSLPATGQEKGGAGDIPKRFDWSAARKLAPGTEVMVTVKGSKPVRRYVVLAGESELTALNLTDPTLPRAATRVLRDMASNHPEYFAAVGTGGYFQSNNVRMGPAGVFVADRKVADLSQVVETIARDDVVQIGAVDDGPRVSVRKAAAVGAAIGAAVFLVQALAMVLR